MFETDWKIKVPQSLFQQIRPDDLWQWLVAENKALE